MEINLKVGQNIRKLRIDSGLTQEQLADFIGVSSGALSHYENGIRGIPLDELVKFSNHFHIALDALIKYDLRKVDMKGLMKVGENRLLFPIVIQENSKVESIEIVPIKASAGYRKGYADPQFIESLPKIALPFLGVGTYRGFQISGDSMPPIPSESYIIGKYVENFDDLRKDKSYICLTKDDILYKKIENKIDDDGKLHLISNNSFYPNILINPEDVMEIWQYKCFISLKDIDELAIGMEYIKNSLDGISKGIEEIKEKMLIK